MDCIGIELAYKVSSPEDAELAKTWNPDTDLLIYSGEISDATDHTLINILETKCTGKRVFLLLTTPGGDADAAYRLARYCQLNREHFTVGVFGVCKSAGTLLALGAHELVVAKRGELGPLDVQTFRPDEFMQMSSGLTISQALDYLTEKVFESWESIFLQIRAKSQGVITTKTAGELACSIVTGLYSPISDKIDPQRFGEMQRSLHIATEYGKRLGVKEDIVEHLCKNYPAHSFVIDFAEAQQLLQTVRSPTPFEELLVCNACESLRKQYKIHPVRQISRGGFIGLITVKIESELPEKTKDESGNQANPPAADQSPELPTGSQEVGKTPGKPVAKVAKAKS